MSPTILCLRRQRVSILGQNPHLSKVSLVLLIPTFCQAQPLAHPVLNSGDFCTNIAVSTRVAFRAPRILDRATMTFFERLFHRQLMLRGMFQDFGIDALYTDSLRSAQPIYRYIAATRIRNDHSKSCSNYLSLITLIVEALRYQTPHCTHGIQRPASETQLRPHRVEINR